MSDLSTVRFPSRIAVVNRGEAAVRLIRAVRELNAEYDCGIKTIALHTDAERRAMFVRQADEAVTLRKTSAGIAYLDHAELERALLESKADAVWVGWGFVAEDIAFAELCGRLNLTFIGPSPAAMRTLGDKVEAKLLAEKVGVPVAPHYGPGKLAEELFDELVVDSLVAPTFVRDFPVETSPLTRDHGKMPGLTEKWDLYIRGIETATGYSELVDPVVQRARFLDQARFAGMGDAEAMVLDEEFLRAMEYGMPPAGGIGMGIDRLIMALTGLGIRETILFPFVRPGD